MGARVRCTSAPTTPHYMETSQSHICAMPLVWMPRADAVEGLVLRGGA